MSNSTEIYKPESTNQENIIDDSKLTQLAPAVHIFAALHFWFSYIYDWLYVVYPPTIMREAIGGKLKYMTYWDVVSLNFSVVLSKQ
ncbi:hypothetical protein C0J52_01649 [Blattella germanica]|nr:hypothetical protein C0J52_01649 [Blattella germanica]